MQTYRFGSLPCGTPVDAYVLRNRHGLQLTAITWGGIVTELHLPCRNGHFADVALGFDHLDPYLRPHPCFGAIIGRVAGRTPGARFTLDGSLYELARNEGPNHLHGGGIGFDRRLWTATPLQRPDGADSLRLTYHSPHGEEGYPGNLTIHVTYTLTDSNEFIFDSEATTDAATPLSLTHHGYFNLGDQPTILDHQLQIHARQVFELDDHLASLGRVIPTAGTASDFQHPKPISQAVAGLPQQHGNIYLLRETPGNDLIEVARAWDPASGRSMTVSTTNACLQLYTSSAFDGSICGKSGQSYPQFAGLALECEGYADGVNHPEFGNIVVRPGHPQRHRTVYAFTTC